jgi:PAS domain S-box-containing protein
VEHNSEEQLRNELEELRQHVRALETSAGAYRRTLRSLREAEHKYRTLVESSLQGIVVFQNGLILFANPAMVDIIGYSVQELTSLSAEGVAGLIHPEDREMVQQRIAGRLAGESLPQKYIMRAIHKDGSVRRLELSTGLVEYAGKPAIQTTTIDITDRLRAEEALRESEQKLRRVIECSEDGIVLTDEQAIVVEWNPAQERITGIPREEAIGQYIWDMQYRLLLPELQELPRAYERVKEPTLRFHETGDAPWLNKPAEHVIRPPGGPQRTVEFLTFAIPTEKGYRAGSVARDITEQKRIEEALRESEERFRRMAGSIQNGLTIVEHNRVVYVNDRLCEITGYSKRELLHMSGFDLAAPEEQEKIQSVFEESKQTVGYPEALEFWIVRKDGARRYIRNSYSPNYKDGVQIGWYTVTADVTEQKQMEMERERLIEELDAFAHTVAHDLKTPLGLIIGFAGVLEEEGDALPMEELQKALQAVARNAHHMNNIVDELLLLASVREDSEVEFLALEMEDVVENVKKRLAHLIEAHQAHVVLPATWAVGMGYAPWVEEVWVNYLDNAIRYGGRPPRIELGSMEQEDGFIRFWIRDDGPGLSPEEQARLFIPFTRLRQVRARGHGLGLSIVRRIVERLGGQVGVESEVGKGSEFYFTLPAG